MFAEFDQFLKTPYKKYKNIHVEHWKQNVRLKVFFAPNPKILLCNPIPLQVLKPRNHTMKQVKNAQKKLLESTQIPFEIYVSKINTQGIRILTQ